MPPTVVNPLENPAEINQQFDAIMAENFPGVDPFAQSMSHGMQNFETLSVESFAE